MKWLTILLAGILLSGSVAVAAEPTETRLIYEVVPDTFRDEPITASEMESLIAAVDRRLNHGGFRKARVRRLDERRIVISFSPDQLDVEGMLSMSGTLEFRILADENASGHKELSKLARALDDQEHVVAKDGKVLGWWVPVQEGQEQGFQGAGYQGIQRRVKKTGGKPIEEILVYKDRFDLKVTDDYLVIALPSHDTKTGNPSISLRFIRDGARKFSGLTAEHLPDRVTDLTYKMGIILNGKLYSAPSIQSTIRDRAEITGSFTTREVNDLVDVLNAGTLPVAIRKFEPGPAPKR